MKLLTKKDMYNAGVIAQICQTLSETTADDWFFSYSPHVENYSVRVYLGGWSRDKSPQTFTIHLGGFLVRHNQDVYRLMFRINKLILQPWHVLKNITKLTPFFELPMHTRKSGAQTWI